MDGFGMSMKKCDVVPGSSFACDTCGAEFEDRRGNHRTKVGERCNCIYDIGKYPEMCQGSLYVKGTGGFKGSNRVTV